MTDIFKGRAKRLDDTDLPRIGSQIGVGEDEIHAFLDVEASGEGFDSKGRVKILFEPHIFYRELGPGPRRNQAVTQGLAYAKWRPGKYPADSYPRLLAAMEINADAALRSASYGLGQIMGFNHVAAGYPSVTAMVKAFADDEENHVQAMVNFLKAKGIDDDLRAHNWQKIEDVYNGGGFNGAYATKMRDRFRFWQKIKDTPWDPKAPPPPDADPAPVLDDTAPAPVPPEQPATAAPAPAQPPSIQKVMIYLIGAAIAVIAAWFGFGGK